MYHDEKFKVTNQQSEMLFREDTITDLGKSVNIWTDGACVNNGKPTAQAAWACGSGKHEAAGRVMGRQTNNTAEAYAI